MTMSNLTLNSQSLRFWSLRSPKEDQLMHLLLLNINRKAYMGVQWHHQIWPGATLKVKLNKPQFYRNLSSELTPYVGKTACPPYHLTTFLFFNFLFYFKFWFFYISFHNVGSHGSKNFKRHLLWKYTSESL